MTRHTTPLWTPCEGSGVVSPHELCPVCGAPYPQGQQMPEHDRRDVLAMIDQRYGVEAS
jgi:hypothetical protein